MNETPVFSVASIRALEKNLVDEKIVEPNVLMQHAGAAALIALRQYFPAAKKVMIYLLLNLNGI